MTAARLAIAALAVVGCERATSSVDREERCFADEIGTLTGGWTRHPECATAPVKCDDACRAGDPHVCVALAFEKPRDPANHREAQEMLRRACKLGLATGCTNWAANVWTSPHDISWHCLIRVFAKSCAANDPWGCGMMGRLLIEDSRTPIDVARGLVALQHACQVDGITCRMLARYVEQGRFGPADRAWISELMDRACQSGDREACGNPATVEETYRDAAPPE